MYLSYQPEGNDQPIVFDYKPNKIMSAEREALERRTGLTYEEIHVQLIKGSSVCRRALLHMYLKRTDPRIKYEDVDFAWDELNLKFHRAELLEMRESVQENYSGEELATNLKSIDDMLAEEPDPADETVEEAGKAPSND